MTRDGYAWTFAYGTDSSLTSITDSFGRAASFTWNQYYITSLATPPTGFAPYPEAVATITLPDSTALRYSYDPPPATSAPSTSHIQRLTKVERLDAATTPAVIDSTTYHYENSWWQTLVTGITDNRGVRITTYGYDGDGRGTSTTGALGANSYSVAYTETSTDVTRTVTNPLGKDAVFTFHRFGSGMPDFRLTAVNGVASTNCPSSVRTLTYGTDNFIATEVDEEGRTTSYVRDALGHPTTTVEAVGTPLARTTTTTWHPTLNVPTSIVKPGLTEDRTYDSAGQLQTVIQTDTTTITVPYATNGRTKTWTYAWGTTGLLTSIDGPLSGTGDTVSFTYDSAGYLATRTDQVGHVTTISSRDAKGAPLTTLDENSVQTVMTYDGMGRPKTVTVNPGSAASVYAMDYDDTGNLTKLTAPGGGWTSYHYDDANRVDAIGNDRSESQTLVLNAMGETTSQTIKNAASTTTQQQTSAYDELGRIIRSIGAGSQTWAYGYDKVDNLKQTTDARSKLWQTRWDALDRTISDTDPQAVKLDYSYAPNDSLTRFEDGRDLATTRIVDGFGLTIFEHSPDRGDRTYWYDKEDRLTKMVETSGVTSEYSYDATGRQLTQTYPSATAENIAYTYDATASGNKGVGRLTSVTDPSGASSFVYDAQGRMTADNKTIDGQTYSVGYSYDTNGAITAITYPSGHIVTYTRASDGKVTAVSAKSSSVGSSTTIANSVAYAPFGPLTTLTYGNGLDLLRSYDLNYWLSGISLSAPGVTRLDLGFGRNANGDLTSVTDPGGTGRAATFTYTDADRLATSVGAWGSDSFTYDAAGNRTTVASTHGSLSGAQKSTFATDSNRIALLSATGTIPNDSPVYTTGSTYDYVYDARKRLQGLKLGSTDIASYQYDYAGHRVATAHLTGTPSSSHYIFDQQGQLLAEHDGATGAVIREYIWLDDMPLALVTGSVSTPVYSYVHTGQIGEPLLVTDAAQAKLWDAAVDPWGRPTMLSTPTQPLDLRLPGQWLSAESGLHQNWMRDYDPVLGAYVEADPLGIEAGQNSYSYAENNPIRKIDPKGQLAFLIIPGICAAGGCEFLGGLGLGALWYALHPPKFPPRPLCPPKGDNDDDCDEEWADAYAICKAELAKANPNRRITGGYKDLQNCARGLVSQRCGGNKVAQLIHKIEMLALIRKEDDSEKIWDRRRVAMTLHG